MTVFLNIDEWPRAKALARRLIVNTSALTREGFALQQQGRFTDWPEDINKGGCALVVAGERREWEEGGITFFDDTVLHSAHNRTNRSRLVLLLDLKREAAC